jgi:hypothetical protein
MLDWVGRKRRWLLKYLNWSEKLSVPCLQNVDPFHDDPCIFIEAPYLPQAMYHLTSLVPIPSILKDLNRLTPSENILVTFKNSLIHQQCLKNQHMAGNHLFVRTGKHHRI